LNGDKAQIGFSLGVEGRASLAIKGQFHVKVIPEQNGNVWGVRVTLDRIDEREGNFGLMLTVGADFSSLAKSAEKFLRARLPATTPVDALLDKLTNPAGTIKEKIGAELEKLFKNPQIAALAKLATGIDRDSDALAKQLAGIVLQPVTDLLDRAGGIGDTVNKAKANALAFLTDALGGGSAAAGVAALVDASLGTIVDQIGSALNDTINDLRDRIQQKTVEEARALLAPFAALGDKIAEALDKTVGAAGTKISQAKAVQAIREGLAAYAKLREEILGVLADAQRAKLVANASISISETRGTQSMFTGWFGTCSDMGPCERLYRALWRGHLNEFRDLIEQAERSGGLQKADGWLLRTWKRVEKESVSVSLLGYDFTDTKVRTTELTVKSDKSGNIMAFNGTSSVTADINNYWLTKQAQLAFVVKLLEPGKSNARSAIEFGGAFTASGRDVDEKYLSMLQLSLQPMSGSPLRRDLLETAETRFMDARKFWNSLTLMLPISINDDEWRTFTRRSEFDVRRKVVEFGMHVLDLSYKNDSDFRETPSQKLLRFGKEVNKSDPIAGGVTYLANFPVVSSIDMMLSDARRLGFDIVESVTTSPLKRQATVFLRWARVGHSMATLARASTGLQTLLDNAATLAENVAFDRARPLLREITEALDPVAVASLTFTGKGERPVPWPLVLFAMTLASLCGRDVPPGFLPMAIVKGMEDQPIPLLTRL
jgi:hypothetical protein